MKTLLCLPLLCLALSLRAEEPWGKDAEMVCPVKPARKEYTEYCGDPVSRVGQALIRFHQCVISPADGPRSHYYPSSSQYTLVAMRKYGFITGVIYGCDRLMRENCDPWIYPICRSPEGWETKYDPVR